MCNVTDYIISLVTLHGSTTLVTVYKEGKKDRTPLHAQCRSITWTVKASPAGVYLKYMGPDESVNDKTIYHVQR